MLCHCESGSTDTSLGLAIVAKQPPQLLLAKSTMSIDINWETLTQGRDGEELAESIRAFIHERFQRVTLPRMIRSVKVQSFEFGSIPPRIEVKDVCDPLPDFYEGDEQDDEDGEDGDDDSAASPGLEAGVDGHNDEPVASADNINTRRQQRDTAGRDHEHAPSSTSNEPHLGKSYLNNFRDQLSGPLLPRAGTPGILGGTSNLGYFHLPLSAGLSGTTTPLAAVAGAQFQNSRHEPGAIRTCEDLSDSPQQSNHRRTTSFGSLAPSSATTHSSRPTSRHQQDWHSDPLSSPISPDSHGPNSAPGDSTSRRASHGTTQQPDRSVEDVQIVFHINYAGDVKLCLTAEILLDYPMPSFVGIPLQLNITGLTFDGVGMLAYIKRKAHFCFLCPEDAEALVGNSVGSGEDDELTENRDHGTGTGAGVSGVSSGGGGGAAGAVGNGDQGRGNTAGQSTGKQPRKQTFGGLLEEIKVESEIGQRDGSKQVLKNVGKVEKFILEQVRRIFDEEFVYPSYWTFLV